MMRPVTDSEWLDAAGGAACPCDHHDPELCSRRIGRDPCACDCHYRPDLRLVPSGAAPKESCMRRERPRTFERFERLYSPRGYVAPPAACPECRRKGYNHERWCPRIRGVQVGAAHLGKVHQRSPRRDGRAGRRA
ncbi:hypothetical protein WMF30_10075 [Sorangium sp. So ce134]